MFFDTRRTDTTYPRLLRDIARKQQELLHCHFNWKRRHMTQPAKDILGRKRSEPVYEGLLQELNHLKKQAAEYRRNMGLESGIFWWSIPWDKVERYLIFDLNEEAVDGGWRFERSWELVPVKDVQVLMLREEGHYSSFSQQRSYETGIISAYSAEEINSRMNNFNHMMNVFDLAELSASGNAQVHSILTGADYDSAADYLLSGEHFAVRSYLKEQKARSLYTETENTTVYAVSSSRHYCAVFAVGQMQIGRDKTLNQMAIQNYRLCGCDGDLPEFVETMYSRKDAAAACAAFLADSSLADTVPMDLFGKNSTDTAACFEEAIRQAEINTCLAEKIICD